MTYQDNQILIEQYTKLLKRTEICQDDENVYKVEIAYTSNPSIVKFSCLIGKMIPISGSNDFRFEGCKVRGEIQNEPRRRKLVIIAGAYRMNEKTYEPTELNMLYKRYHIENINNQTYLKSIASVVDYMKDKSPRRQYARAIQVDSKKIDIFNDAANNAEISLATPTTLIRLDANESEVYQRYRYITLEGILAETQNKKNVAGRVKS